MSSPGRGRGSGWGYVGERYRMTPNRAFAIEKGKKNMLYKYPRGRDNMISFDLRKQFRLSAHPQEIGTESVGLGLYFTSVLLLISFFVILSLFSLYPMFSNWHANNFAPYEADGNNIGRKQDQLWGTEKKSNRIPIVWGYPTYSYLTRLSLGSFCGEAELVSWFYCPMECGKFDRGSFTCGNANRISGLRDTGPEAKQWLISKKVDSLQLWDVTMMNVLFMAFLLFLKYIQSVSSERMNASATTASDYTVYVEGLPRETWVNNDDIAKFFAHYGTVVSVAISYDLGKYLAVDRQIWDLRNSLEEARARDRGVACNGKEFGHRLISPLIAFIYWRMNNGWSTRNCEAVEKLEKDYEAAKLVYAKMKAGWTDKKRVCQGRALVTFDYEDQAKNCLKDQEKLAWERFLRFFRCRNAHPPRFKNQYRLKVSRAPETADVMWENCDISETQQKVRDGISIFLCTLVVAGGFAIQYYIEKGKDGLRGKMRLEERQEEPGRWVLFERTEMYGYTLLGSLAIVIIGLVVGNIVRVLVYVIERPQTRSQQEKRLLWKLTLVYLINGAVLPFVAMRRENWYVPNGGLMEQAFYIQCINAFVSPVYYFSNPYYRFIKNFLAYHCRTQRVLDAFMAPEDFILAEQYATILYIVGLAFIYGPAMPLSYPVALLALVIAYWTDKYVALRRCKVPHHMDDDVQAWVSRLLGFIPLVQLILAKQVYFKDQSKCKYCNPDPFIVGIIIWGVFMAAPVSFFINVRRKKLLGLPDRGTRGISYRQAINARDRMIDKTMTMIPGRIAHYMPFFRDRSMKKLVKELYEMPPLGWEAIPDLLEGQLESTLVDIRRPEELVDMSMDYDMSTIQFFPHSMHHLPELPEDLDEGLESPVANEDLFGADPSPRS